MLTFAEYKKKMVLEVDTLEGEPATERPAPKVTMPDHLAADLERTVDQFVGQLKQQLANPTTGPDAQRGIWDRMKNWWSNMWHGRYNQQNPYFWKNKLGDDLGRAASPATESLLLMPLEHYAVLQEQAELLELSLPPGAEGLQVTKIVDQWAGQFKKALVQLVSRHNTPVTAPLAPGEETHEEPEAPVEPEATPADKPKDKPADPIDFDHLEDSRRKLGLKKDVATGDGRTAVLDVGEPATSGEDGGKLKPPRTAPLKTGSEVTNDIDPKVLHAELESLRGEMDDDIFDRLKGWIDRGTPEFLASVQKKLKFLKELKAGDKEEDYGLNALESTVVDRTAFVVSNFRHLVKENNKDCQIIGRKKNLAVTTR